MAMMAPTPAMSADQRVLPEYLVFEVPEIPLFGPFLHSWFVLRGPLLWTNTGFVDLRKVQWPKWELKQVPSALTYTGPDDAMMIILDGRNEELERLTLKKGFVPQLYQAPAGKTPRRFRIELTLKPERVRLTTKDYPWPKNKEIFHCDIAVVEQNLDEAVIDSKSDSLVGVDNSDPKRPQPLEDHDQVRVCMESLQGVAKSASAEKQWYVDITWPKALSRRSLQYISDMERLLKSNLARNKHVLIARRGEGKRFVASAGLTQIEFLQPPSLAVESLPRKVWHGPSPPREKEVQVVGDFSTSDGGRVVLMAFASDQVVNRSIDSPAEFDPAVNIQFMKSAKAKELPVRQTDFREERTGIIGFLRPWYVATSANYHTLKSGRGEELASFNAPGLEVAWKSPFFQLEPFFTLEPGFFHDGSPLALQEGHFGARWRWREGLAPYLGFFSFQLRGTNPGATRLGSIEGPSAGLSGMFRFEDYIVRGWLGGIWTTPFSYDSYLELSRILERGTTDRGFFVGIFTGYTVYRQDALNLTRRLETFSETRFKVGISIGLAGAEFLQR